MCCDLFFLVTCVRSAPLIGYSLCHHLILLTGEVFLCLTTVSLLTIVYGVQPDMTRDGCSIPVTLSLQNALHKNIVLLPIGACDDGAHSQNEKMNRINYIQGVSCVHHLFVGFSGRPKGTEVFFMYG